MSLTARPTAPRTPSLAPARALFIRAAAPRVAVSVASSPVLKPFSAVQSRPLSTRRRGRGGFCLRAAWGDDVVFSPARVLESAPAAHSLHRVLLDIGAPAAAGYTTPGQYIQAKLGGGKPGFFAIASPPDANNDGVVELLIKAQGETAEALCAAAPGSEVSVSPVMGKGFPVTRTPPSDFPTLLLFATGSGISPVRALIESGALAAAQRKDVRLYYGVRSEQHMAFADRVAAWEAEHGVKVVPVFSEQGGGYVQDAFAAAGGAEAGGAGVAAVLCGQKGMAEAVTEMLTAAGVQKEHILTNF